MVNSIFYKDTEKADAPLVYLSTHFIRSKEYLEAIVASTSDAICTTDMRGRILYMNPGAERMLGRSARQALGVPVDSFYEEGKKESRRVMRLLLERGSLADHETVVRAPDGRKVHISMSASLLKDREGRLIGTLGISKDIGRRVELERRLRELSITDSLTGLYNQRHFIDRVSVELQRARRQRQKLSLIVLDLDRFKRVNDKLGHLEGDRILRETADAIRLSIRKGVDEAFRYGGDEFTVLLPGLGLGTSQRVVDRIHAAAERKSLFKLVGISIGVSSLRRGDTANDFIRRADQRMYLAKRKIGVRP